MPLPRSNLFSRLATASALALLAVTSSACVGKPTMHLNHAEIRGVRISFPPSAGVLMNVYVDVYNPNFYDVAVRAVRGQVVLGNRYQLPVHFQPGGEGVWLTSKNTTTLQVPVDVPVNIGWSVVREAVMSPMIPYTFQGHADVTATRSFQLEKDDYSVNEQGAISRQQIQDSLPFGF